MTRIVLHIDRLVLNGIGQAHAPTLSGALRDELARRLAAPATGDRLAALGHVPSLPADKLSLTPDASPRRLGTAAGRAIAKGIAR